MLITSGGTLVPIDPVRDIKNKSKGTFGSKIAAEALKAKHAVTFLRAKGSKSPMEVSFDFSDCQEVDHLGSLATSYEGSEERLREAFNFAFSHTGRFHDRSYQYYNDYAFQLEEIIKKDKPDIVVLAAAVSDYLVKDPATTKVRSKDQLKIELEPAEKLISKIKEWHPDCLLVGFKMLVACTDTELFQAATDSIHKNGCDIVVANDYMSIVEKRHRVIIVRSNTDDPRDSTVMPTAQLVTENLAQEVMKAIETLGRKFGYV